MQRTRQLAEQYRSALLEDVIPFWLRHALDQDHGGIMTALDRDGSLIDTDKSVWFQGRAGWMFATLYNTVERRAEWLEAARHETTRPQKGIAPLMIAIVTAQEIRGALGDIKVNGRTCTEWIDARISEFERDSLKSRWCAEETT